MTSWLIRFWTWIKEAKIFWLATIVLIASLWISLLPTTNESRIRIVGLFLQLGGIMTVAWGIAETRRFFGRPSVMTLARNWFNRFPPFKRKITLATSGATLGISMSARAHVWNNPSPDASLEDRVSVLEKNLDRLKDTTHEIQHQLDDESRLQENALVTERQSREAADLEIHNKLEATETGGLNLSLVGVVWLSVGLILSTIPTEILSLFN